MTKGREEGAAGGVSVGVDGISHTEKPISPTGCGPEHARPHITSGRRAGGSLVHSELVLPLLLYFPFPFILAWQRLPGGRPAAPGVTAEKAGRGGLSGRPAPWTPGSRWVAADGLSDQVSSSTGGEAPAVPAAQRPLVRDMTQVDWARPEWSGPAPGSTRPACSAPFPRWREGRSDTGLPHCNQLSW